MTTARVHLPFPPSVNNLFASVGNRRVPTPRYRSWKAEAAALIMVQRAKRFAGPVNVRIDLVAPDRRRRDVDNHAKAPLDALVAAGVLADDSDVRRISIGWEEAGEPCTVTVTACDRAPAASIDQDLVADTCVAALRGLQNVRAA